MKKFFYVFFIVIVAIFSIFAGHKLRESKTENMLSLDCSLSEEKQYKIDDFFPFRENLSMEYSSSTTELNKKIYVDFIKEDKIQYREVTKEGINLIIYSKKNGELSLINKINNYNFLTNKIEEPVVSKEVLLKEPIAVGNSWILAEGEKREITAVGVELSTEAGNFNTVEVTTYKKDQIIKDYYGEKAGLVKTINKTKEIEKVCNIKKIYLATFYTEKVKFFSPAANEDKIVYSEEEIKHKTNLTLANQFEEKLKIAKAIEVMPCISEKTKINSIRYNGENKEVEIDLSKEFMDYIKEKKEKESEIALAIANTIGSYFNVEKVFIKIEGNSITFPSTTLEGYIKANYKEIVNLK